MSDIPTWHERAIAHPDHQSGMISEDMIRARMAEEIADLRAEVERLRAALAARMRQPLDGADAQALEGALCSTERERDEARARAAKLLATLEMVRDADNDCRVEGWATIPDAVRRSIDEALEAKP